MGIGDDVNDVDVPLQFNIDPRLLLLVDANRDVDDDDDLSGSHWSSE